jgi:hypothetical protein
MFSGCKKNEMDYSWHQLAKLCCNCPEAVAKISWATDLRPRLRILQDEKRQSRDQYLGAKRRVSKELGPLHIGVVEPHAAVIISVWEFEIQEPSLQPSTSAMEICIHTQIDNHQLRYSQRKKIIDQLQIRLQNGRLPEPILCIPGGESKTLLDSTKQRASGKPCARSRTNKRTEILHRPKKKGKEKKQVPGNHLRGSCVSATREPHSCKRPPRQQRPLLQELHILPCSSPGNPNQRTSGAKSTNPSPSSKTKEKLRLLSDRHLEISSQFSTAR